MEAIGPQLEREVLGPVAVWTDPTLARSDVTLAFTERVGGVSTPPFDSLNLAGHVGDDVAAVDVNRTRLLDALGLSRSRDQLTTAEQVHGDTVATVTRSSAGAGAWVSGPTSIPGPLAGTDALLTSEPGVPLLLCFADCVPIVLVAPGPAVAVVHAGWRGCLASLPGKAARALAAHAGCERREIVAYLGPHIGACHYEVAADLMSQFVNVFDTVARAKSGGLDLGAAVCQSLNDAGVLQWRITSLGVCTAEATGSFFSYRAEQGETGRHGALVCIASR